jgi:4-amino-4-deoxy-L-arabinose transferase-like glycosyltransferase
MIDARGEPSANRLNRLRAALLAVVLLLSSFVQFTVVLRTTVEHPVQSDAIKYVAYAWNLVHDGTFSHTPFWTVPAETPVPDKLTLPGYPAFLSLFLGDHVDPTFVHRVVLAQACLGVLTCALTLLLALRILPFGFAVLAGVLVAISPHLASISTYLLTESLFTALLTLALYLGVRAANAKTLRPAALAGAALALASLVRPQMQLFPWLLLMLCLAVPTWRRHARKSALALLVFVVVMAPWQLRNLHVTRAQGDPDLLVATLYHGSFPGLMYQDIPESAGYPYNFDPERARHTADLASVLRFASDGFRAQPARFAEWYLLGKPAMFLSWRDPANASDIFIYPVVASPYLDQRFFDHANRLMRWLHMPLMLLALGAVLAAAIRPALLSQDAGAAMSLRLLALTMAYVLFTHMLGAPFPRYAIPFRPLAYVLGMAMASAAWTAAVTNNVTFGRRT